MWDDVLKLFKETLQGAEKTYLSKAQSSSLTCHDLITLNLFLRQASIALRRKMITSWLPFANALGFRSVQRLMSRPLILPC
jgi:hypothetical protein